MTYAGRLPLKIASRDFWVKVVGMLQQNWALIETRPPHGATVYFITERARVFDEITFETERAATAALRLNGFLHYGDDTHLQSFNLPPEAPFQHGDHPNGRIYSSGRFWRAP